MELQPPERPGDYNQALMELGLCACRAARPCAANVLAWRVRPAPWACACEARPLQKERSIDRGAGADMENRRPLAAPAEGASGGLWQPVLEGARSHANRANLAALGVTARAVELFVARPACVQPSCVGMDGFACAAQSCGLPPGCV
ncbi:MAG: hypothetical protein ACLR7U_12720 [Ruthenibacterium lactatiformans]